MICVVKICVLQSVRIYLTNVSVLWRALQDADNLEGLEEVHEDQANLSSAPKKKPKRTPSRGRPKKKKNDEDSREHWGRIGTKMKPKVGFILGLVSV